MPLWAELAVADQKLEEKQPEPPPVAPQPKIQLVYLSAAALQVYQFAVLQRVLAVAAFDLNYH